MFVSISQSNVITKTSSTLKSKLHVQQWSVQVDVYISADEFKSKAPNPPLEVNVLHSHFYCDPILFK